MTLQHAAEAARAAYRATAAKDRGKTVIAVGDALEALVDASQNITEAADNIQVILQKTHANLTEGERRALWSELSNIRMEAYIFGKKGKQAKEAKQEAQGGT